MLVIGDSTREREGAGWQCTPSPPLSAPPCKDVMGYHFMCLVYCLIIFVLELNNIMSLLKKCQYVEVKLW